MLENLSWELADALSEESRRCAEMAGYSNRHKAALVAGSFKRAGYSARLFKCRVCGKYHVKRRKE